MQTGTLSLASSVPIILVGLTLIFFTGHSNNPAIEFFFKRMNATVLIKPFKLTALDSTIKDVLRKIV